jgi:hypothetical protein
VTKILGQTAPSLIQELDLRLAEAGYDVRHDYSGWRWTTSSPEFHAVAGDFPRITSPVPLGVSTVTYAIALSACAPFCTDWHVVRSLIKEVRS